ncbi:hypothetical protein GXN76_05895 [Kroppenstedtia pulmonis]|uniref:Uncharacterized protein n=1 Tax=Kroppenstedtia pulmonis TaxID=1380685 RepID=A0A7D4BPF6_9BACL|nr:hypothetical protein [Kroppenstedtia pulmonis]QKG84051.1 hypothetical protein GXN76_05895 [Kroppenstedtia pulmonis]
MFLHGIPLVYFIQQFPCLSSSGKGLRKSPTKRRDARRLSELVGFEPVHLLRSTKEYALSECVRECFQFGDVVLAFPHVGYPRVQLSPREWGVRNLNVFDASWAVTTRMDAKRWIQQRMEKFPVLYVHHKNNRLVMNTNRRFFYP